MSFVANKPEPLTDAEISNVKQEFIASVVRELAIIGKDSAAATEAASKIHDRVFVRQVATGTELHYRDADGSRMRMNAASIAAREIVELLHEAETLASHGPDPRVQLAERLVKLGVAPDEAATYAERYIVRLLDGRVSLRDLRTGDPRTILSKKKEDEAFTDAQWAAYRDGSREITEATREILADIQANKRKPQSAPIDREQEADRQNVNLIRGYL